MKPHTDTTAEWLAREIFKTFQNEGPGLEIYELDCGCIYYHLVFKDSSEDERVGVYRNPANGSCGVCMSLP